MHPLPVKFIERVRSENPNHSILLEALESESPISIRVNPLKLQELNNLDLEDNVPWCQSGFYLKTRPKL